MKKSSKGMNKIFLRSLKQTRSRFISIFCIVLLGAAVFGGLRNSPITMRTSMNDYLTSHHFPDLSLISTLGFNEDDLEYIQGLEDTKEVEGCFRTDFVMSGAKGEKKYSVVAHSKNDYFNQYEIVAGKDIEADNEILIDRFFADESMIGKTVVLENSYGSCEAKIVGLCDSPFYIVGYLKGTNTYSNESNNGFIIMNKDLLCNYIFPEELYTLTGDEFLYNEILVSYNLENLPNYFVDAYDDETKLTKINIEDAVNKQLKQKRKDIIADLEKQLEEPTKQYEDGLKQYEEGLDEYNLQIADAKQQIIDAKLMLVETELSVADQIGSIENYDDSIQTEINTMKKTVQDIKQKIITIQNAVTKMDLDTYNKIVDRFGDDIPTLEQIQEAIDEANVSVEDVIGALMTLDPEASYDEILETIKKVDSIDNKLNQLTIDLNNTMNNLDEKLTQVSSLSTTAFSMVSGLVQLEKANLLIEKNETALQQVELTTGKELEEAKEQLEEAKIQLEEARESIASIPDVTLYALSHNENYGTASYTSDSGAIEAIAKVFPLVFFLVAALVSLTTMTRMVEEQRSQTGILRALGYEKIDIILYYVKYVVLATVPAAIIGMIIGTYGLSFIIYFLYTRLMYMVTNAPVHFVFLPSVTLSTLVLSVGITLAITLVVIGKELASNAAMLMRPKSPKAGRRVFLENINFIWKRFTFNQKVTIRNLFRYKKRALMSIIGIAGCSALLVTGLGIKLSISGVVEKQFDKLWLYDSIATLRDCYDEKEIENLQYEVESTTNVASASALYITTGYANSDTLAEDKMTNVVVLNDRNSSICKFYLFDNEKEEIILDDEGVFISAKLSEDLGIGAGDSFNFTLDNQIYSIKVSEVIEGYISNYMYMSTNYYEQLFSKEAKFNKFYIIMKDNDPKLQESFTKSLKEIDEVLSMEYAYSINDTFDDMLASMNYIIMIISGAAATLAFIVLYNLTNINIQERVAEIATLKVLGFYPKETYDYIFKENTLLGIIGSIAGLFFGTWLHRFIILLVETEAIMFRRQLNIYPYLFAIVLTFFFIELINFIMRKTVDEVKMVESLKSVE